MFFPFSLNPLMVPFGRRCWQPDRRWVFVVLVWAMVGVSCRLQPFDDPDADGFTDGLDCAPTDPARYPGAQESCNSLDDDCDGTIDESGSVGTSPFYIDYDGDGVGVERYVVEACTIPAGYSDQAGDCDDTRADIFPGALERCDGDDNNCNAEIDEGQDQDLDGYPPCATNNSPGDCDDEDPSSWVGGIEVCDGRDNDCDGQLDELEDTDDDGFAPCPTDGSAQDCNDADPQVSPVAYELCNRQDDDCDGDFDEGFDQDQDGFTSCGTLEGDADCDDLEATIHPDAVEVCDGRDQDCDGTADEGFVDEDGDGVPACVDCDDANSDVSPLAYEQCDGFDNNCNGVADDGGDCPCAVEHFGGRPYQFCLFTTDWMSARDQCAAYGYHLVHIGSKEENDWILYTASTYLVIDWWIGLNDLETEGTFRWLSGEPVAYTRWASGEPNNINNEDCAQLYPDGTWNDKACSSPWYRYLCEAG